MNIIIIIILLSLLFIFIQDIKFRHIHFVFPTIIFICSYILLFHKEYSLAIIAYNIFFFLITFFFLISYMSIRKRRFINPFKNYFGIGDVVFYISIAPAFLLNSYVVFFIFSMIFSLSMQLVFNKKLKQTIPLAGFASLLLIFIIIVDLLIVENRFTIL